jgi:predicted lipoprotein with Yx(FWY)xxD motif
MRLAAPMTAAAALALAACSGGNSEENPYVYSNTDTVNVDMQQPANSAAAAALPGGVKVAHQQEYGDYLVDAEGRSLYVLAGSRQSGEGGGRQCDAECQSQWPAFTGGAPSSAGGAGQQPAQPVTFAGWPLYYYAGDRVPGSASGQGYADKFGTWHLLSPQGEPIQGRTLGPAGGE